LGSRNFRGLRATPIRVILQADALDFAADALTYGISPAVIGARSMSAPPWRWPKGSATYSWVFGTTLYRVIHSGVPEAGIMGAIGFLALLANLASVLILVKYKSGTPMCARSRCARAERHHRR